jgi:DNA mismatch repair protein MutS2
VATTHLAPLKAYAYGREGVQNVAVEFDPQSLRPTYRLIYGASGQSNALALARGFGFPPDVVAAAEATLAGGDSRAAALLRDIETARRRAVSETRRAERLRQRAAEAARRAERREADLEARRSKVLAQAREQAARTVAEADAEMRRVLDDLKARAREAAVAPHVVAGAKGALRHARERLTERLRPEAARPAAAEPAADDEALGPGDRVRVASLGRDGEVVSVDAQAGQAEVSFGSLKLKVPLGGVTRLGGRRRPGPAEGWGRVQAAAPRSKPRVRVQADAAAEAPEREVNVIGLRVDEALPVVDKSLDDALLAGVSRVAIVHGTGTGRLRAAIRQFLRGHRAVRGVAGGDPARGGDGVTLVDLGG